MSMMTERLGDLAVTSINKTAEWLKTRDQTQTDSSKIINDAKAGRKTMQLKRRQKMDDSRNERLKKLIRFAPGNTSAQTD